MIFWAYHGRYKRIRRKHYLYGAVLWSLMPAMLHAQEPPALSWLMEQGQGQNGLLPDMSLRSKYAADHVKRKPKVQFPKVLASKKELPFEETVMPVKPIKRRLETDPFDPIGMNLGMFNVKPYVALRAGYESNPAHSEASPKGSALLNGEIGSSFGSLWSQHSLTGSFRLEDTKYTNVSGVDRLSGDGRVDLRMDLTKYTALDFGVRGNLTTTSPNSPEVVGSIASAPLEASFGARAGVTEKVARWQMELHGAADRKIYEDADLVGGGTLELSLQNYNTYGVEARVGYELRPDVVPFVEVGADRRKHDQSVDLSGYMRDSNGAYVKIGTLLELTHLLKGSVDVGYLERAYDDPRLQRLKGVLFDANLKWDVTPLTQIDVKGTTNANESNIAGASGSLTRGASLTISHALSRRWTVGVLGGYTVTNYQGVGINEKFYKAKLFTKYAFSRYIVLEGSLAHERLRSTEAGSSYQSTIVMAGMKFQR